ncbi:MAG: GGDEF domain-containing protein, partial [Prochlorococcaceae cyanobacterium]
WLRGPRQLLLVAVLGLMGFGLNLQPIPLLFGVHLLLGSIVPVLVLLLGGGVRAIPIGLIASLATITLWGHGWAVLTFSAEIIWLTIALNTILNRDGHSRYGHVVVGDVLYWLVLGAPLVFLLYYQVIGIDLPNTTLEALKQGVNGVLNTALAFAIFLAIKTMAPVGQERGLSLKDLILAITFLSIAVPSLILTVMSSHELVSSVQDGVLERLDIASDLIIKNVKSNERLTDNPISTQHDINFEVTSNEGIRYSSNRQLFKDLRNDYNQATNNTIKANSLGLISPRQQMPEMKRWVQSYWARQQTFNAYEINGVVKEYSVFVVEAATNNVIELHLASARSLGTLAWILVLGSFLSEVFARFINNQFTLMLSPLTRIGTDGHLNTQHLPELKLSLVTELQDLALIVNQRGEDINRLTNSLQSSNKALEAREQELERLTTVDPLTGCFNRRELFRRLNEEILRGKRSGAGICAIAIDIDFFKTVNDTYGHDVGDQVLVALVEVVRSRLRGTDMLCRTGGEEFVVLLFGSTINAGLRVAESIRTMVKEVRIPTEKGMVKVTISLGVADWRRDEDTSESLLIRSDLALLEAKRQGRDQVIKA